MYAVFAVRWHRFFLLDERKNVFIGIFSSRDWRFFGYMVLLTCAPFVPWLIFLLISSVTIPSGGTFEMVFAILSSLLLTAALILLVVLFRFSLVLPGTAVDRPLTLAEAWHKMLGHTWRFIGAFFLVMILYVIPFLIVSEIFGQSDFDSSLTGGAAEPTIGTLFATEAVKAIFGFLFTAAGITVLSTFYRHIIGAESEESGAVGLA